MENTELLTRVGFALVTLVTYGIFLVMLKKALSRSSIDASRQTKIFMGSVVGLIAWLIATAALASSGFLGDFTSFPPKFFIVIIIPLITVILISRTKTIREILAHMSQEHIVYLQSFRIAVEVLLWMLFMQNLLPVQMTFEGRNFDVLSGVSALVAGYLVQKKSVGRLVIYAWNVVCLLLLINIVTIALLSTPTPMRVFMNEPANTIVTKFPYVWLPALLVPMAYTLSIWSILKARNN